VIVQRGWLDRPLMLIRLLDSMIDLRTRLKCRDRFKDSSELTEGDLKCARCRISLATTAKGAPSDLSRDE
jgi:hypothetical protein